MSTTVPTRTRVTDLPPAFWWLWLSVLVTWVGRFVVPFLALFLTSAAGMSSAHAGWVISAYGAGVMISALIGGVLADRLGRKVTLVGSEAASVVVLLVVPQFIESPLVLPPLLLLYGLINGAAHPAIATLVGDLVAPEHRRGAYSFHTWAVNLGYAIGPVLAGLLAEIDYALLFYGQAGVVLVAAVIVLLLVHDPVGASRRADRDGKAWEPGATGEPPESGPAARLGRQGLRDVLTDKVFLGFTATMFCYYCVYVQSTTTLPVVMSGQGFSSQEYGYMLTLNGLLLCALQVPSLRLLTTRPHGVLLVGFMLVTVVGMLVQASADLLWIYLLSVALWTLGELGLHPTAQTTAADLAISDLRGRYQGAYALAFSAASMVAPVLGGTLLGIVGSRGLWLACAGVCLVVAVLLGVTSRQRERRFVEVARINAGHSAVAPSATSPAAAPPAAPSSARPVPSTGA